MFKFRYIIVFILTGLAVLYSLSNFKKQFAVEIKSNLSRDDEVMIATVLNEVEGSSLWEVDIREIRSKVLSIGFVKSATVKAKLPNVIYISIVKRQPYAVWWNYKSFFLIDTEGVVVNNNVTNEDRKKYIFVIGENAASNLPSIADAITHSKINSQIASVRFISSRRWDIILNDGTLIKLPEKNPSHALVLFDALLNLKLGLIMNNTIIDMRLAPEKVFIKKPNVKNKEKYYYSS